MRTNKRTFPAAEIIPPSSIVALDLKEIFGRTAPLEVDLGCGDGSYLVALAQQNPAADFIGVERLPGRIRSACRKIGANRLTNARILPQEILHTLQQLLSPGSIDVFHLMFSDPWPKRRHHNRRVVNEKFLRAVARALKTGGELRIATDHGEYFEAILETARAVPAFSLSINSDSLDQPATTFEKYFQQHGADIQRAVLRKVSARK